MYAQILIAVSFGLASYQDFHNRAVSDMVWIPGALGIAVVLYGAGPNLELSLIKLGLFGGIGLAFVFIGGIGQADAIAIVLVAGDPNLLSPIPPLIGAAGVSAVLIGYQLAKGNVRGTKSIPIERFLKEKKWIPKALVIDGVRTDVESDVNIAREDVEARQKPGAMVEVSYGVPTVEYIGIGYVLYLAYLLLLSPSTFAALS